MFRKLIAIFAVASFAGCSEPPSKGNGDSNNGDPNNPPNNSTNNGASNNGASNNGASNNGASNNGGSTVLRAADYDQTCMFDHDCTEVVDGEQCGCAGCFNAAINSTEKEAWEAAREGLCPADDEPTCVGAPCVAQVAACHEGTCDVRQAVYVDVTGWDTSCASDADCSVVPDGEICSACQCGGTAVSATERTRYDELRAEQHCTPGPDSCDCPEVTAWCNAGTCEIGGDPVCTGADGNGFFANCDACGDDCDSIDTGNGPRNACGCASSADCPCSLRCGDYEIAPNVTVSGICVR